MDDNDLQILRFVRPNLNSPLFGIAKLMTERIMLG